MMRTNQLTRLSDTYRNVMYTMIEEQQEPNPNEAVIQACQLFKSIIYREHAAIEAKRRGRTVTVAA